MRAFTWRRTCIVASGVVIAACGRRLRVVDDAFTQDMQLPPGSTVHLYNTNGAITVAPASGTSVHLQGSKRWHYGSADDVHFMWKLVGTDLYACAVWGTSGHCDERGYRSSRPAGSLLRIFSLFHRGRSDMAADLRVTMPAGFAVVASTVNGPIRVDAAAIGVRVKTINGPIVLQSVGGPVDARSVNGGIEAVVDSLPGDAPLRLETVNGSVTVRVPDSMQGRINLSTVNGGATTDFPVTLAGHPTNRQIEGSIGHSPREVVLRSVNGSVELLRAGALRAPGSPAPAPAPAPAARGR